MKIRGLVHVHSTISFDGRLTLRQIHDLASSHGFRFVLVTEHIEGLSQADVGRLIAECCGASDPECLLVPGLEIEAQCQYFVGVRRAIPTTDLDEARRQLLGDGAVAVLAHPHRMKRDLSSDERDTLSAIEIWNVKDDGGRVPGYVGYMLWRQWRIESPATAPAPVAGIDLHDIRGFKPIGIELDLDRLDAEQILLRLRTGTFSIVRGGDVLDPDTVSASALLAGRVIAILRVVYKRLRLRFIMPNGMRRGLRRLVKG